jgi:hypothetical protein
VLGINALPTEQAANEKHSDRIEVVGKGIEQVPQAKDKATENQRPIVGLVRPSTQVNRRN